MARQTTESSFDELTRGLASGSVTRGKALRLMGAALVGGTLTSFGIGGVAAADEECKPAAKKCRKNHQCCSGTCEGGKCAACQSGQVLCGGSCVSNSCTPPQTFDTSSCTCCTSNGGTCSTSGDCCSGNCSEGFCCESGRVGLSNGTCAKPCTLGGRECTGCLQGCTRTPGFETYCSGGFTNCLSNTDCLSGQCDALSRCVCSSDNDCPSGQFCVDTAGGQAQVCQAAC